MNVSNFSDARRSPAVHAWAVACVVAGIALAGGGSVDERVLFDFDRGGGWPSIDDVVMGGRSSSEMIVGGGYAAFRGDLSLANGGGFASVRSEVGAYDLSGYDGIRLTVTGDGKRYGFRLRTDAGFDGVSYHVSFETEAGRTLELRLPFADFEPRFRGRVVAGYPALDPARVRTFGLIVADRQAGRFELRVERVAAYRTTPAASDSGNHPE